MADHAPGADVVHGGAASGPTPRAPAAPLPRWLLRLARVRQWLAVAALAYGAFMSVRSQVALLQSPVCPYEFDPAPLFYLAGAVGLALRAFWARYLAICFAAALLTINVFWGAAWSVPVVTQLAFILLLSGPSMRSLFEETPGKRNRWAVDLDQRVGRLRLLFVAQSVALAMIWAPGATLSPAGRPLALAAGVALAGLAFQGTWGALLLVPILAGEVYLASLAFGVKVHWGHPPASAFPITLLAAVGVSAAVIAPFVRAFARRLFARDTEGP